ncbi:MAG: alpha/beta hydrolase [Lachnospiraceae bacterium]|nr:alpha/beta hydrolase [Lachnospiraceae bacterium]
MKEIQLPSHDGVHKLHVVIWEPETEIRAVLQISHGMIEMIERYDDFAGFLNTKGILVIGNDHLGHGHTADSEEDFGYFCPKNMSATVVDDLHSVTEYAKKEYPGVPYFLLGHSMGSFMARRYLMTYGKELTGAVIMGTGRQPKLVLMSGKVISTIVQLVKGSRYHSVFLKKLAFGAYCDRIPNKRTESDWLTRDEKIVDFCISNKYCNFSFTVNGYKTLFDVLTFIQKKENVDKIPKKLPIFMVAGNDDPVGEYGKGVKQVFEIYKQAGIEDVSLKLYEGDRHEILNELDKENVYEDIYNWLVNYMV